MTPQAAVPQTDQPPNLEELFLEFVNAVRVATDLTAVNIAAGIAWQALEQLNG